MYFLWWTFIIIIAPTQPVWLPILRQSILGNILNCLQNCFIKISYWTWEHLPIPTWFYPENKFIVRLCTISWTESVILLQFSLTRMIFLGIKNSSEQQENCSVKVFPFCISNDFNIHKKEVAKCCGNWWESLLFVKMIYFDLVSNNPVLLNFPWVVVVMKISSPLTRDICIIYCPQKGYPGELIKLV